MKTPLKFVQDLLARYIKDQDPKEYWNYNPDIAAGVITVLWVHPDQQNKANKFAAEAKEKASKLQPIVNFFLDA